MSIITVKSCRRCGVRRLLRIIILLLILEHGSEIYDRLQWGMGKVRGIGRRLSACAETAEDFFRGLGFESVSESEFDIVFGDKAVV